MSYPMNRNINTWHYRGGLSNFELADDTQMKPRVIYSDTGQPLVYGVDENGYPILIGQDSAQPWWANLINKGIETTGDMFGGRRRDMEYLSADPRAAATVQANLSPGGISSGFNISTNTLLLLGVVAAVFFLGRGRR